MPPRLQISIVSLACALAFGLAQAPARAADGTLEIAPKVSEAPDAPAGPKVKLYGASKALVVGIDDYGGAGWFAKGSGWPKLSKAVEDAEEVAKALTAKGFTVTLLKDLKSAELDLAFRKFFIGEGADPEARLLIWFAGHGHTIGGEGYLVPADAPDPDSSDIAFRSKALSLRRFGEYMREARAKHVLAVFDSCFGGTVFNVARARPPRAITLATTQTVRQFISSGDADQVVSDNGAFRRLFVDALEGREPVADPNGDGYITGTELGLFISDKVTNYSEKGQTPRYGKLNAQGYDRGDFVLEKGKLAAPPAAADPAPAAGSVGATQSEIERAWGQVQTSESVSVLEAFRKQYGAANALYDQLAAKRIVELKQVQEEAERERLAAAKRLESEFERLRATGIDTDLFNFGEANPDYKERVTRALAERRANAERARVAMLAKEADDRKRKEAEELKPGSVFRDCDDKDAAGNFICPEMVVVPAGEFLMGSTDGGSDEKPPRKVTISKPFAVGKYEVTFAEWDACVTAGVCDHKPRDEGWGRGKQPVIYVSWEDAKGYAAWLSKKTGKPYRLLSEAEWEYAARAGTATKYSWGDTASHEQANYGKDACCGGLKQGKDQWEHTAPVGSFPANAFGLHDMQGNVWEWVEDCYKDSYQGAPTDGSASTSGICSRRVLRGGSWYNDPGFLRSALRGRGTSDSRVNLVGFRVGRTLSPSGGSAASDQSNAGCTILGPGFSKTIDVAPGHVLCDQTRQHRATVERIAERVIRFTQSDADPLSCSADALCQFAWPGAPPFRISASADPARGIEPRGTIRPR